MKVLVVEVLFFFIEIDVFGLVIEEILLVFFNK